MTRGEVRVSAHDDEELATDGIRVRDLVEGMRAAELLEDRPVFPEDSCTLARLRDRYGNPVQVLWDMRRGATGPAVLGTAFRPDSERWSAVRKRRRR